MSVLLVVVLVLLIGLAAIVLICRTPAQSKPDPEALRKTLELLSPVPGFAARERKREPITPDADKRVMAMTTGFAQASLLLVQPDQLSRYEKAVAIAYLWGAVDALGQRYGLYDVDVIGIHIAICINELGIKDGGLIAGAVQSPKAIPFVVKGGNAILAWLSDRDANAPLILGELLRESTSTLGSPLG